MLYWADGWRTCLERNGWRLSAPVRHRWCRDDDLERLIRMVDDPATRLVTVTGRGGVGKTRLALAAAEVIDRRRPGSVVFVDLAPLTEPGQVLVEARGGARCTGRARGVGRRRDRRYRTRYRKLVILDNMEHLVDSGAGLAELLGRSPTLRILVTSQKPLRLRAEHVLELGALPVPPERPLTTGELARIPAVQLFVARAEAADPSFHLTDGGAPSVAALCRAIEGLPLAIELAAVPSASLAPADLQDRLGSGALLELPAASADVPPRQASLRSALEWTTGLLDDGAHSLLGALAVLASPFDLRDAVDLADADAAEAERSLWQLTELHLVERLRVDGRVRFRLADSVREFALQELDRSTRRSDREERAVHWLAGRARRAAAGVDSTEESSWRSWLAEWHTELVRATRAALRLGLVEEALELLTALCPYWRARGPSPADIDLAAAAVSTATALGLEPPVLAEVLVWIGLLGLTFGDPETWPVHQANLERGESLARAHDDRVTLIRAVGFRALSAGAYAGDYAAAAAALEEGTALAQAVGSRRWLARFTLWSAMLAHQTGDDDRAAELGLVALLEARRQRDGTTEVLATTLLSPLAPGRSSVATELPTLERALELAHANGQFQVEVSLLAGLALAQLPGRPDRPRPGVPRRSTTRCRSPSRSWHRTACSPPCRSCRPSGTIPAPPSSRVPSPRHSRYCGSPSHPSGCVLMTPPWSGCDVTWVTTSSIAAWSSAPDSTSTEPPAWRSPPSSPTGRRRPTRDSNLTPTGIPHPRRPPRTPSPNARPRSSDSSPKA